jgi:hypothetical protein
VNCPDGFAASIPGDGNPVERAFRLHVGKHDQNWATALQGQRMGNER